MSRDLVRTCVAALEWMEAHFGSIGPRIAEDDHPLAAARAAIAKAKGEQP